MTTDMISNTRYDAETRAEYDRRIEAVRALMRAEGWDVVVATDHTERHIPGGHVRYLSGFGVRDLHSSVVVPLTGEPTLVVQPGSHSCFPGWAADESWITQIRSTPTDSWPPRQLLGPDIARAIIDDGNASGRIGMCGQFPGYEDFASLLPHAEVGPALLDDGRKVRRDLVERVRAEKSDWEIARLRRAQELVDIGMRAFFADIEPGRKLVRAVAAGSWAAASAGADEFFSYMASSGDGPYVWWQELDNRVFGEHDLVSAEANARFEGYLAQIARAGAVGTPRPDQQKIVETSTAALAAMVEATRPGMTGADVYAVAVDVVRAAGLAPNSRFGHGMGISMAESVDIMPRDDTEITDRFCLELHPGVWDEQHNQSAMIGDQFIFRDGRLVPLSENLVPHDLKPGEAHA